MYNNCHMYYNHWNYTCIANFMYKGVSRVCYECIWLLVLMKGASPHPRAVVNLNGLVSSLCLIVRTKFGVISLSNHTTFNCHQLCLWCSQNYVFLINLQPSCKPQKLLSPPSSSGGSSNSPQNHPHGLTQ
jgi:hypothetical protein